MKKGIIILLVVVLSSFYAQSQIAFGPKIGFTASKLTEDDDVLKTDFNNSVHFGVFARLGKKIFIQPELVYMTKGTSFEFDYNDGLEEDIKLSTIDIPIMLGVQIIDLRVLNGRIQVGPVASLVVDKDIPKTTQLINELPKKKDYKDFTWSIMAGLGIDVFNFTLDIRYEFGLNEIYEDNTSTILNTDDIRNNVFLLSLGYKIF